MQQALGVPTLIPNAPRGADVLYTHVVTTDAELLTAMTTPGDVFITAGSYTLDLDAVAAAGGLDTTPRVIRGAGITDVTITLTVLIFGALDFGASLTDGTGVTLVDLSFVAGSAGVGPGVVAGVWGAHRVRATGIGGTTINGFFACFNLTDCVGDEIRDTFAAATFFGCRRVENCVALNVSHAGFSLCTGVNNCRAETRATIAGGDEAVFSLSTNVSNCLVEGGATTTVTAGVHNGFGNCTNVAACEFEGPSPGVTNFFGFNGCVQVTGCRAQRGDTDFAACLRMSACQSSGALTFSFDACSEVAACESAALAATGTAGFNACRMVTGCHADTTLAGPGFIACLRVVGCLAEDCATSGFIDCIEVAGCFADGNAADGFNICRDLSSCRSVSNTLFGYQTCAGISSCSENGTNGSGPDAGSTRKDPVTNTF